MLNRAMIPTARACERVHGHENASSGQGDVNEAKSRLHLPLVFG